MNTLYFIFTLGLAVVVGTVGWLPPIFALMCWLVVFPPTDVAFAWGPRAYLASILVSWLTLGALIGARALGA